MATVVLRPTSVFSSQGFASGSNPTTNSFDEDNATYAQQTSGAPADIMYVLEDLDSGLSGATINSFTISGYGKGGRAGAFSADCSLVDSGGTTFATETETWGGSLSTQTTSARTTQGDGSSALTYAYINGCRLYFNPNTQGAFLYEIYITVDYTAAAAGYTHDVNSVAAASIGKVNSVATASIGKINSVD